MQDNRRYYSLDALRGSMMMLGIVLHACQWYLVYPPGGVPLPMDPSRSYLFDLIMHFIHSFRMPLFFVLAGFFTSLLVGKRDFKGTYQNRFYRIFIPLVLGIFTLLPLTLVFMVSFLTSAKFGTHQFLGTEEQFQIITAEMEAAGLPTNEPSFAHLWFLYYLCYFYLLIPICFWLSRWSLKLNAISFIKSPWLYLLLGAYTCLTLWPFKGGALFEGFIYVTPHLPSLLYYGSFFVLGYLFHNHRVILETFSSHWATFGAISLVLFPLSMYATHQDLENLSSGEFHLFAVIINAFLTWSLIYFFIGLFLRFFDKDSPWSLYISNSSYWVYLLHMPVVVAFAWLLLPLSLPAIVKFGIIVAGTSIICFVTYHYLVQGSWLGQVLHGKRFNQTWPWLDKSRG